MTASWRLLFLLAGLVAAIPLVYWGQNGGGTVESNDLSAYCTSAAGIDVILLAFLQSVGYRNDVPSGTTGQSCSITNTGQGQNCGALASAITTYQSKDEATTIGNSLWKLYGNSNSTDVRQRPFIKAFVNGFDFDLERNSGNEYYPVMISTLRSNFGSDPHNTYYITGAPQCPIPEPNMGVIIESAKFDYLWPQFYNNNNYSARCALPVNGNAPFNYDCRVSYTASTPSANAKLFIGVPAAPLAANGGPAGETYYATPQQLSGIVMQYTAHERFSGIMMWSAGFSDSNVIDGCTYAQQAKSILTTGSPDGSALAVGAPQY
ncbi:glycoside hydrolase family 18 protein [Nemania serpens]|nr:glycoside hydrolase family 18 protein [Nemania serpens]